MRVPPVLVVGVLIAEAQIRREPCRLIKLRSLRHQPMRLPGLNRWRRTSNPVDHHYARVHFEERGIRFSRVVLP